MYTDLEIQTAVEQILLPGVSHPYDPLGARRTDVSFTELQLAAASALVANPDAPFYLIELGCKAVVEAIEVEKETIQQLQTALTAAARLAHPIKDLTPLLDAHAALLELERATASRKGNISSLSSYSKYTSSLGRFLTANGSSIRYDGDLIPTPQEAKELIPTLLTTLKQQHTQLQTSVDLLSKAHGDYNSMSLPSLLVRSIVTKVRTALAENTAALAGMTPTQRLSQLRSLVLASIAGKAAITQFGLFAAKTSTFQVSGSGSFYADAQHPATPASVSTVSSLIPILETKNVLDVWLATASSRQSGTAAAVSSTNVLTLRLTKSGAFTASVGNVVYLTSGSNSGTRWTVSNVVYDGNSNIGTLYAGGTVPVVADPAAAFDIWPAPAVTLPLAPSYTPEIVVTSFEPYSIGQNGDINDTLKVKDTNDVEYTITFPAGASLTAEDMCTATFDLPSGMVLEPIFGIAKFTGCLDILKLTNTSASFTSTYTLPTFSVGDVIVPSTGANAGKRFIVTGMASDKIVNASCDFITVTEPGQLVSIGSRRRFRLRYVDQTAALSGDKSITVVPDGSTAAPTLGLVGALYSKARKTSAVDLATDITNRTNKVTAAPQVQTQFTGLVRTVVTDPTKLIVYRSSGTSDIVGGTNEVTLNTSAAVVVGDKLILRTGPLPDSVWVVDSVNGTTVHATGHTIASALAVEFDIQPTGTPSVGNRITIDSGPNKGEYRVTETTGIPFDVIVNPIVPVRGPASPQVSTGSIGSESVLIASTDITMSSYIRCGGLATDVIGPTKVGTPESVYFELPTAVKGLAIGDLLEIFESDYNTLSFSATIKEISATILTLSSSGSGSWSFTDEPPFVRLRAANVSDCEAFSSSLSSWLSSSENHPSFFLNLSGAVNSSLLKDTPPLSDVNTIKASLDSLLSSLTSVETTLTSLTVRPIPVVDTLLQTFRQKGADRAIDILLSGRFSEFFGLSMDSSSYSGHLQSAIREVARNDLATKSTGRVTNSRLLIALPDKDYETDTGDSE